MRKRSSTISHQKKLPKGQSFAMYLQCVPLPAGDDKSVDQWMLQVANCCNHQTFTKNLIPAKIATNRTLTLQESVGRTSFFLNTDPNPILTSQSNNLQTGQMDEDGYIFSLALVKYFFTSKLNITAD